jgi:hypothetical protein
VIGAVPLLAVQPRLILPVPAVAARFVGVEGAVTVFCGVALTSFDAGDVPNEFTAFTV